MEKCDESSRRSQKNILPETFLFMQLCGLWQPFNYNYLKIIYILYSIFVLFTMISVGLALILFVFISSERIKEALIEHSFLLFTLLNAWVKTTIFLSRQKDIKSLLNTLLEDQCQPKDKIEHEIQKKFDTKVKLVFF
ncbi:uncharacterized protein LOC122501181 [Leptopilina heterotoma]|uniref:uncharacterized protein LOC122501181 n=1 Tax=Leptopilina heterotoma TaxID=63436 RepID=UPI001CA8E521|nr:uncharacterized protein LOC122501181 [Leptopilina heterotoma]